MHLFPLALEPHGTLQTVALRRLQESDVDELFACVDANRSRLRQWMPWLDMSKTPEHIASFIAGSEKGYESGQNFRLAILSEGRISGICGLEEVLAMHRRAKIGYWLDSAIEGKGVMNGVVQAFVEFAFSTLNLNLLEIYAAAENTRSRNVAQKLGFTLEGVLRQREWLYDHFVDLAVYSQTQAEWTADQS